MSDPWLTIIGLGEDGLAGLSEASRAALKDARIIFGGPRHLDLVDGAKRGRAWPVPFSIDPILAERPGGKVVVVTSGDPFWYGAGGSLSQVLSPPEWIAHPAPSTFGHAAARMGWRIEDTICIGLHAAPFERLLPHLNDGQRFICLVRDGSAPAELARWLTAHGFGCSEVTVLEALAGPRERVRTVCANTYDLADVTAPVALAFLAKGAKGLQQSNGLPDDQFASDGQITKSPIRALTLAALAPRAGEVLWDLGAGSGSISVEWCLSAAGATAHALESRADRVKNIVQNARAFGLDHRLAVHETRWQDSLAKLPQPAAVFVGGGVNSAGLETLWQAIPVGVRLVINAVTLESEALLMQSHQTHGGELFRFDVARAMPIGRMQGWTPSRPVVQWSVVR